MQLRHAVLAALAALPLLAQAAPTSVSTGQVVIDYDPDTFTFNNASDFGDPSGPTFSPYPIGDVVIGFSGNRADLTFTNGLRADDSAFGESDPLNLAIGLFSAPFAFAAQPGWVITGYRLRAIGTYSIEVPGEVSVEFGALGAPLFESTGTSSAGVFFDRTLEVAGGGSPGLVGQITAYAMVNQISLGFFDDLSRPIFEFVPDDPSCSDPFSCPGSQVLVGYEQIERFETDLGAASINVDTLSIEAITRPVPEPSTWALLAAGLGLGAGAMRRRSA
jgi:hypothetical protein